MKRIRHRVKSNQNESYASQIIGFECGTHESIENATNNPGVRNYEQILRDLNIDFNGSP